MRVLNNDEQLQEFAKSIGKWCLVLHASSTMDELMPTGETNPVKEINKAVPYLTETQCWDLFFQELVIVCDSEEECNKLFLQTIGDDGPNETNTYTGPANVFAMTISSDGVIMAENT